MHFGSLGHEGKILTKIDVGKFDGIPYSASVRVGEPVSKPKFRKLTVVLTGNLNDPPRLIVLADEMHPSGLRLIPVKEFPTASIVDEEPAQLYTIGVCPTHRLDVMRYVAGSIIIIVVEMNDILARCSADKLVSFQSDRTSRGIVMVFDARISQPLHEGRHLRAIIVDEPLKIWPVLGLEAGVNQR